jgi:NADH-quinone oxidoreductase subunit N
VSVDLRPLVPALIVAITGMAVLLAQAFSPRGKTPPSAVLSLAGLGTALLSVLLLCRGPRYGLGASTGGAVSADAFALFLQALVLCIGVLVVLLSPAYLRATGFGRGEYYSLVLFSIVGMLGLVSTTELISLFVALEIMSVALYALTAMRRDQIESQEAAIKYFVTGAFSSAFFLYGIAMLFGVAGSTSLGRIASAAASPGHEGLAIVGAGLLLVGLGFKVASVPFHMWAPDVYEGAPTTVTAFMSAGVKAAAFGALIRIFGAALPGLQDRWQPAVAALAVLTMVVGNLGALSQTSVKRMLAWSSVAHAGYLLTALVAAPRVAAEAVLFYLVGYAAVNLGGFGAIAALARDGREPIGLDDLSGLARRRPALAAALTVYLVSLTGVPISAGFVGKFYLFGAAVGAGHVTLAIVGVVMSVVSAYYYLRVVVHMYMKEPTGEDAWSPLTAGAAVALFVSVVVVLGLGVYPTPLLDLARAAARAIY